MLPLPTYNSPPNPWDSRYTHLLLSKSPPFPTSLGGKRLAGQAVSSWASIFPPTLVTKSVPSSYSKYHANCMSWNLARFYALSATQVKGMGIVRCFGTESVNYGSVTAEGLFTNVCTGRVLTSKVVAYSVLLFTSHWQRWISSKSPESIRIVSSLLRIGF